MKTPQFRTFRALSVYAGKRARKSAARNDPIAWAYWKETERWALRMDAGRNLEWEETVRIAESTFWDRHRGVSLDAACLKYREAAEGYSVMKWCAAILRAHGKKVPMSLRWMREAT